MKFHWAILAILAFASMVAKAEPIAGGSGDIDPSDYCGSRAYKTYSAKATGYYPKNSRMEGGHKDRVGKKLHTLEDVLEGRAAFVSVAMDAGIFPYGTRLYIPEINERYHEKIEFRVVDTGEAFEGRGTDRIDICVANYSSSVSKAVNRRVTLVRCR